ncbi:MAG TPA: (2Fe-2S) ferredoxin domain-containing protein [Chloroflexota bacterium]|nr:(2Fe-2S) ferredoxin domain-containing protein [Chloroflexota bacterium]
MFEQEKARLVLVCQNVDCLARGADKIIRALEERLSGEEGVEVKPYMCFGACQDGPNVVVYPDRAFYSHVQLADVDDIANHAKGGPAVQRLEEGVDPSLKALIFELLDAGLV